MPVYEYKCYTCGIANELEKSIHEDSYPICCGMEMSRVYGNFGITFKGTGWGHQ